MLPLSGIEQDIQKKNIIRKITLLLLDAGNIEHHTQGQISKSISVAASRAAGSQGLKELVSRQAQRLRDAKIADRLWLLVTEEVT